MFPERREEKGKEIGPIEIRELLSEIFFIEESECDPIRQEKISRAQCLYESCFFF